MPRVALSASANSVPEAEPVTFSAQLSGNCPNIQYRFVFGDGSSSNWQSSRSAQHSYARAGKYLAYVDISDGNSRIGGSPRIRLDVTRRGPVVDPRNNVSVSLTAEPMPARQGTPVTFTAKASPARADARYLFNFGDGDRTSWQTDPQSKHTYKTRGVYRPYVQVSQFVNNQTVSATSAPAVLRVGRGPDTPGSGSKSHADAGHRLVQVHHRRPLLRRQRVTRRHLRRATDHLRQVMDRLRPVRHRSARTEQL